jgi:uncharacterized glyoxalase superfamily protein PhnB
MAKRSKAKKAPRRRARRPAKRKVQAVPPLYGSVTPALVIRDCTRAIEFYKQAFGAKELSRMPGPDGKLMHAEIQIAGRVVMLGDEAPAMGALSPQTVGGSSTRLMLYVKDCDAVFQRAVAAGATAEMPPADMFWGDRYGTLVDPFGHKWAVATHLRDMTPKQMAAAAAEFMAQAAGGGPPQA